MSYIRARISIKTEKAYVLAMKFLAL